jgi:hypothetical protein
MKSINIWKLSTLGFAGLSAFLIASTQIPSAHAEKQPHMQAAKKHLNEALDQLQKASADKGGHRVKAMALTKEAIEQVEKGIAFDNKH